jgi:hypothetical protein
MRRARAAAPHLRRGRLLAHGALAALGVHQQRLAARQLSARHHRHERVAGRHQLQQCVHVGAAHPHGAARRAPLRRRRRTRERPMRQAGAPRRAAAHLSRHDGVCRKPCQCRLQRQRNCGERRPPGARATRAPGARGRIGARRVAAAAAGRGALTRSVAATRALGLPRTALRASAVHLKAQRTPASRPESRQPRRARQARVE